MTSCVPEAMNSLRLMVWMVSLFWAVSMSAAESGLSILCDIDGRSLPLAGVDKNQLLVRDGAGPGPHRLMRHMAS